MCILLALAASAGPLRAQDGGGAYGKLDISRLLDALEKLEMEELRKAAGSDASALLRAMEDRLVKANALAEGPDRDRELGEIAKGFRSVIGQSDPKADDPKVHFRARLMLARTLGLIQVRMACDRMLELRAGDADRRAVRDFTGEAHTILGGAYRDLENRIDRLGAAARLTVRGVRRRLQAMLNQMQYRRGWVSYFLASSLGSLPPAPGEDVEAIQKRRAQLYDSAITDVIRYAEGDAATGVKYWSLFLCGAAMREKGEFERAKAYLRDAGGDPDDKVLQLRASFELVKTFVDEGKWAEAETQITAFCKLADGLGIEARTKDMMSALLRNHRMLRWAKATVKSDPATAAKLEREGWKAFMDLLEKYPQEQAALARVLGRPYVERKDLTGLPPVIAFAKGLTLLQSSEPDLPGAIGAFRHVLADKTLSASLKKLTLASLGGALYSEGTSRKEAGQALRLEAADLYGQVAKEFSDDLAFNYGRNAVVIYRWEISALQRANKAVPAEIRRGLIRAMETILTRKAPNSAQYLWRGRPRTQAYPVRLAREYEALGEKDKARQWLEQVDKDSPDYWIARYNSLVLRLQMVRTLGKRITAQKRALSAKIVELAELAEKAEGAARQLGGGDEAPSARAEQLAQRLAAKAAKALALLDRPVQHIRPQALGPALEDVDIDVKRLLQELQTLARRADDSSSPPIKASVNAIKAWTEPEPTTLAEGELPSDASIVKYLGAMAGQGRVLVVDMKAYATKAGQEAANAADPQVRTALRRNGANAARLAASVLDNILGDSAAAKAQCEAMTASWAEYEDQEVRQAVQKARKRHVVLLFTLAQIDPAISALTRFRADYGDAAADALAGRAALGIREQMQAIYLNPAASDEGLAAWRKPFLDNALAAVRTMAQTREIEPYVCEQMAAEALLENGRAAEALPRLKKLKAARPGDPRTLHALARCHSLLKQYAEALQLYQKLTGGLDRWRYPRWSWRIEWELSRCAFDAAGGRADQLSRLLTRLEQLQARSRSYGGYVDQFAQLRADIAKAMGK